MKKVDLYTDGACSGNPGAGGYCAILIYNGIDKIISGSEALTTNNRMELLAVIRGLEALKEPCLVDVYSDSQYVVDAFNQGWIEQWKNNAWRNANKKEVKNIDLWQALLALLSVHKVTFIKVKGHADNELNNKCDKIAVEEYKKLQTDNIL
jgi:ribonuclease HI